LIIPEKADTFPASNENFPYSRPKMYQILIRLLAIFFSIFQTLFKSKRDLLLENLVLRQQLSIFQIKKTVPELTDLDRS